MAPRITIGLPPILLSCKSVVHRRHLTISASEAAERLVQTFSNKIFTKRQFIDANQIQKLSLTLGRKELNPGLDISETPPPSGTPVPPGYHLVYFSPGGVETELGPDGTDRTFNSPAPFTRRMWAGGRMRWESAQSQLRVGQIAEERTKLLSAVPKRSRDGGEMVVVDVEKQFWGEDGLVLVDQRSWVFRPEVRVTTEPLAATPVECHVARGPSTVEDEVVRGESYPRRKLRWSSVGLFRFSALTFNGHKIHYDESWTQSVENHPGQVVHGPLNLISMLDYWRDACGHGEVCEISYRALSPLYAGDAYEIRALDPLGTDNSSEYDVLVEKAGVTCMKGRIKHRT